MSDLRAVNDVRLNGMAERGAERATARKLFDEYRALMAPSRNAQAVEVRLSDWLARWDSLCMRSVNALRSEIARERRELAADRKD